MDQKFNSMQGVLQLAIDHRPWMKPLLWACVRFLYIYITSKVSLNRVKHRVATRTFYLNYYYAQPIMVLSALLPYANIVTLLLHTFFGMYVCMYACMHACMYVCMYVCMYICIYVCMCVWLCVYVCMYVCMYIIFHIYPYSFINRSIQCWQQCLGHASKIILGSTFGSYVRQTAKIGEPWTTKYVL